MVALKNLAFDSILSSQSPSKDSMDIAATHSQNIKPTLGQPLAAEFKLQLRVR
jgi:hypothetical protein